MADSLILCDDDHSLGGSSKNKDDTDSLNSSDEESPPKIKKKKSNTRRGIAKLLAASECKLDKGDENNIYTSSLFGASDPYDVKTAQALGLSADSDVEEEVPSIFFKKTSPKSSKNRSHKEKKKSRIKVDDNQNTEEDVVFVSLENSLDNGSQSQHVENGHTDGDSDDAIILNTSQGRRSPTPPPSEGQNSKSTRGPRKMKGVKSAMTNLSKASVKFKNSMPEDESDVSIIEANCSQTLSPDGKKIICVKVRSRSGIQRFSMRKEESFSRVIKEMAQHEFAKLEQVVIFHNDQQVQPYDSPNSLGVTVADILECHICNPEEIEARMQQSDDVLYPEDDPDVLSLTVQGKDLKSKRVIRMRRNETMERLMKKFSKQVNVPLGTLSFQFDGETLEPSELASDLDLEDGYCIDVIGV